MLLLVVGVIGSFKLFCLIAFPLCKILCLEDTLSQINQVCRCVCVCVQERELGKESFFNWIHCPFCYAFICISFDCVLVCFYLFLSPSPKEQYGVGLD